MKYTVVTVRNRDLSQIILVVSIEHVMFLLSSRSIEKAARTVGSEVTFSSLAGDWQHYTEIFFVGWQQIFPHTLNDEKMVRLIF